MVLLDNVVEVFALADHDLGAMLPIVVLDSGVVRAALVDVDDLGKAVVLLFLTARVKKRRAARRSRLAVSKKSTVFPCLSTARYQYRSSPRILMYVSSNLQLLPTAPMPHLRFRLRKASSSTGTSLMTQR